MKEVFERYHRKRLKELIRKGEKPIIIAGFKDCFGDSAITCCSECGAPVFVRPWILEAVAEHHLTVICVHCVDPKDLKDQIAKELTKIQSYLKLKKEASER